MPDQLLVPSWMTWPKPEREIPALADSVAGKGRARKSSSLELLMSAQR
jgi:hypothetical protein